MLFLFRSTPKHKNRKHSEHFFSVKGAGGSQRASRTYCNSAKLPSHHNSLFCLFVFLTSLWSNVWRDSSLKSHSLWWNSKVAVTHWVTHWPSSGIELPGQLKTQLQNLLNWPLAYYELAFLDVTALTSSFNSFELRDIISQMLCTPFVIFCTPFEPFHILSCNSFEFLMLTFF